MLRSIPMLEQFAKKVFGSWSDRELKKILPIIQEINHREASYRALSDQQLRAKTAEFQEKFSNGASLDHLLIDSFAACREAGSRTLGMRHFDVQLIGGYALHRGWIAEMKTGEGKTLVSTLASYLNALAGKGVHIITVNDYLAKRDSEWMGQIHRFLGLNVGCIVHGLNDRQRQEQYNSHITYGTNNEFGFDYLRDNMKPSLDRYVQRTHFFAIIDEVDSILIDEARTPLIISGPSDQDVGLYQVTDRAIRQLSRDIDFTVDEKHRNATLTEEGVAKLENICKVQNLYASENIELIHHLHASLRAHAIFRKDVDYVIRDGEIVIVDEYTGRMMPGRRWSDGLHQAVEAKEGVEVEAENQTLATITLQNYFRMYSKLSGMTGTAETEAKEFRKVYGLEVLVIPPNRPMIRQDSQDLVFRNEAGKYRAVIKDIEEKHQSGRPVLVGTVSVSKSERVSKLLSRAGIPHNVLNAKNHAKEAEIIAEAGRSKAVTIATNMAGRGTDILLGGGVVDFGGLHVIGTERHESRRIDNQLRGRAGRQGDPGSSQFYLSLEDDLMRIFASDRVVAIMDKLGMEEDEPISDRLVTRSIAGAQKRVETHHFEQREHVLKYDDVLNKQREVIYSLRRTILEGKNLTALVEDLVKEFIDDMASQFASQTDPPMEWDWAGLDSAVKESLGLEIVAAKHEEIKQQGVASPFDYAQLKSWLAEQAHRFYREKSQTVGEDVMVQVERHYLIQSLDHHWKDHLFALDKLREGIHLRSYAQKDPLIEYRKEGFAMFQMLDKAIKQSALTRLFRVQIRTRAEQDAELQREAARREAAANEIESLQTSGPSLDLPEGANANSNGRPASLAQGAHNASPNSPAMMAAMQMLRKFQEQKDRELAQSQTNAPAAGAGSAPSSASGATASGIGTPLRRNTPKVGRNDPCPCGSGKKYKTCHGA